MTFNNKKLICRSTLTGFTLIEMLVALAIFSIVVTVMLSVTISLVKAQRKTQNLQLVHDSARYSIEMMAKEIRMSKIIDVRVVGGPHFIYELTIQRLDDPGNNIVYHFYNDSASKPGILARDRGADTRYLNDITKVDIRGYFYPLSGTPGKRLTIVLRAESVGARAGEGAIIDLQTTVTSRSYE
ncbi:MAG: hypothetical protein COU83_01425 [Candidatus Portnoybacteria bacterium CG10_big_fil_rev_8_21_14_0_10_40_22]|uniref:Prepilin-type N-terminal cleavage/methylation domain-containing protein n=1 Tax=Candidatus Portnoybacteria bacterium CG10_big_fil_rev_8_21_14_0_10_40_22 TaxID=1974814 RepID=A0A2M8KG46_9BACT|nr:MAG: hypothetical protein COU83_01425 [Candidatus Portnoybacteria bacterium CG10_big_fil_rev_8_21_14_0_10_40_22]